ncbi:hypothetical protein [Streptomyces sp. NPDC057250]|uniref:hypothetical protein n=1 Tax=Streptomyces sp. NPDC057250 TaxID=3346068 RepID=UPI0036359BBD
MATYGTAGQFEAYAAETAGGWALWVRYVAGDEPVPALPDTMTVRITSRGDGLGYSGVGIVTVTVVARCPRCGGPRGDIIPSRFHEDGAWYVVDEWSNPCGHLDEYRAVLQESRERPVPVVPVPVPTPAVARSVAPPLAAPPRPNSSAGLILAAAAERRGMHARQAADLLEQAGRTGDARRIRKESRSRAGQMSAKAAAHFLHTRNRREDS